MSDEPETAAAPAEPAPLVERLEADVKEAEAALQAAPGAAASQVAQLHQHIDAFWADVVRNCGALFPTNVQNTLNDLKETLRSKLVSLF